MRWSPVALTNRRRSRRSSSAVEALEGRALLSFGPSGPQFRVNTFTPGFQRTSYSQSVAAEPDDPHFALPMRAEHESVAAYLERPARATDAVRRHPPHAD